MSELENLIEAAKRGDLADVRAILHRRPELINQRDQSGATALHYAAFGGHRSLVHELVRQGAEINATDSRFGATPAGWAIEYREKWVGSWRLSWTTLHMPFYEVRSNGLPDSFAAVLRFAPQMTLKGNPSNSNLETRKSRIYLLQMLHKQTPGVSSAIFGHGHLVAKCTLRILESLAFRLAHKLLLYKEGNMKAKTIILTLACCFVGAAMSFAADAFTGTWKLNEAKSKLSPGTPRNTTVVYEPAGDSVKVTIDGTDSDGKPTHNEWTGKFDGKDYPVTGDPNSDARSVKKVDDHTLTFKVKKGGKVTTSGRIVVSADGKTRTVTVNGTDAKGNKVHSTAVYDKQ